MRRLVPLAARQEWAWVRRWVRDVRHPRPWSVQVSMPPGVELVARLEQPLKPGEFLQGKRANLALAAALVDGHLLNPGATFSFWRAVGRPSRARGFQEGRNLVGGRLVPQVGGGLCQLSGILHHLALVTGLSVPERHAHSIDLYREPDRFAPLGSDATVVWGAKDLRLGNPHPYLVILRCHLEADTLVAMALSSGPLSPVDVEFCREELDASHVAVTTRLDGRDAGRTVYTRAHPAP